jgi:predicted component of type VI protein secretion system
MRPTLVGLTAACAILGLAGCSPAASPDTSPATAPPTGAPSALATAPTTAPPVQGAPNQLVCTAMQLAAQGQWSQAETHWLAAEEHAATSNPDATSAFYLLVTDSGTVATDQLSGAPQAADIATYNTDLAGDTAFTAGC